MTEPTEAPRFRVRLAREADQAAISTLWAALNAELWAGDARQPLPLPGAADRYAARLMAVRGDADTRVLVAEAKHGVIGYALGALVDLGSDLYAPALSGFIADLYVSQADRRAGVGRALAAALLDGFEARGVAYTEWNVSAANAAGRVFWRAMGGSDYQIRMRMERR